MGKIISENERFIKSDKGCLENVRVFCGAIIVKSNVDLQKGSLNLAQFILIVAL